MKGRPRLGVSIDGVAALRQARRASAPDPVEAALVAERAGADLITAHLWQDKRHVQERDLRLLREMIRTRFSLYLAPVDPVMDLALSVRPDRVVFVQERDGQVEIDAGLDPASKPRLEAWIRTLHEAGIEVSAVVEPAVDPIKAAHRAGLDGVQLLASKFAVARGAERESGLDTLRDGAKLARRLGLSVAAAGGVDGAAAEELASVLEIDEVDVGHEVCARAVIVGMSDAVTTLRQRLAEGRLRADARR